MAHVVEDDRAPRALPAAAVVVGPIDVKDIPEAQGEYSGYSGTIGRMLREGASADDLANCLADAEAHMGLEPNDDLAHLVATKLVDWYGEAMRRY